MSSCKTLDAVASQMTTENQPTALSDATRRARAEAKHARTAPSRCVDDDGDGEETEPDVHRGRRREHRRCGDGDAFECD